MGTSSKLTKLLGLPLFATPAERFLAAIHTSPEEARLDP